MPPEHRRSGSDQPEFRHEQGARTFLLTEWTALRGKACRHLYGYWRDKRGDRPFPDWADIVLMDLWQVAACLVVKDVLAGGDDFRNRFWGSQVTRGLGFEGTGRTQQEIYNATSGTNFTNYRHVATTGEPIVNYRRLTYIDQRDHVTYEVVHLPLGPAGGPVSHLLSGFDFDCDVADLLRG